jgi:GDP-L-fucose synthase
MPALERHYGKHHVHGLSSQDYDLTDAAQVDRMFAEQKPDVLVHLAALCGGIGANCVFPADFYHRNTLLTALVFQGAAKHGIKKLVYTMGGCSYPADARSPIGEDQMWMGFPQRESAAYSTAKKMGIVASHAYRQQYGLNSVVLIPGNLYGEYDNFHRSESHVIPAMIRRYYEARLARADRVTMWGTGRPIRDFVYAQDVAEVFPYFIDNYHSSEPINISSGTATTIRELAGHIQEMTGFEGKIVWDTSAPDGQKVKLFDVARLKRLGLSCPTPLRDGLRNTVDWFRRNYERRSSEIRL